MRVSVLPVAAVAAGLAFSPALADGVPAFLADGQVYAVEGACDPAEGREFPGLQLTQQGIFGYEFGCRFLEIRSVPSLDGGESYQHIATASCGDDSGISRPDFILLMPSLDGETVAVTSQNDYAISMVWEKDGPSGINWMVQQEYKRCAK